MIAAAETLKKAKWGMFCIPGIAKLEDVDEAARHGMGFIRIGTNVTEAQLAEPFIARAKHHGMFVAANFMKSYAMEPAQFAKTAKLAQSYGVDAVYIVDSAGGMLTEELEQYIRTVQDTCNVPLGFHGHNNLELAVANSLRAVELGVAIIDTSLQGMGRGAGNTPTEIFLVALERKGVRMGINPLAVMDIGERYIKPFIQRTGYDSIDVITGYARFHSSYMGIIREYSSKYRVDPRKLIIALCEQDKVNAPRELVEGIARRLSNEADEVFTARFHLERYHGAEQSEKE
jgi:4-hydroxy-2-oxovalerate aldolase